MRLRLIGLLAILTLFCGSPARAQSYTITHLGSLPGYTHSTATAINGLGQVAGFAQNAPGSAPRPFVYTDGTMQQVGSTNADGQALGINSSEQIAGYYLDAGLSQPFLYVAPDVKHLGTLGGTEGAALAVNESGAAAGWSRLAGGGRHAARFALDGDGNPLAPVDLGTLGGAESFAYGINLFGQVVGEAQTAGGQFRAFFYGGVMTELPTLGGSGGVAWAVNNGQQVVGASQIAGNAAMHAFLWHPSQGIRDLGTLGGAESHARAVNNSGLVVGYSTLASGGNTHAFVWHSTSGMVDLNSLLPNGSGWELLEARSINDAGQIAGVGLFGGVRTAFLLTPPVADCSIALSTPQTAIAENASVTFTVTLTNNGPNGAPLSRAILSLPSGWPVDSVTIPGGTFSVQGRSVVLNFGGLTNGQSLAATVTVTAATFGDFVVTSSLQANKSDPDFTNNSAQVSLSVSDEPPRVDLRLFLEASPEPVGRNRDLTYDFMVTNFGPEAASGTNLVLSLPLTATFVSAESSQGSMEFVLGNPPQQGEEHRNFVLGGLGVIGVGETVTGSIVIQYADTGTYNYILNVFSTGTETNAGDNESSGTHTVVTPLSANISLAATDTDPVRVSQNLTYTFDVTNHGPDTATDVRLAVDLPEDVTLGSTQANPGTAVVTEGGVLFKLGNLLNGTTVRATVVVVPTQVGTIHYSATVTTASDEANLSDNTRAGDTTVGTEPLADLAVTGSASPNPVQTGSQITYTFTVRNNGSDETPGATFEATLPAGVTFVSATSTLGQPVFAGGKVSCDLGTLANQAVATLTILATADVDGAATVTATVDADLTDPNTGNNTASASTTASSTPRPDLTATWTTQPTQSARKFRRKHMRYTVKGALTVHNSGEANAKRSFVTFYLSDDAVFDAGDKQLRRVAVRPLRVGRSNRRSLTYTQPVDESALGKYVIAVLDSAGTLEEASEANNEVVSSAIVELVRRRRR